MKSIFTFSFIALISLTSYHLKSNAYPALSKAHFEGEWFIDKIYLSEENINKGDKKRNKRWIIFSPDGQFKSGGKKNKNSFGEWHFNPNVSTLTMITAQKEVNIWQVQRDHEQLKCYRIQNQQLQDFSFTLKKEINKYEAQQNRMSSF